MNLVDAFQSNHHFEDVMKKENNYSSKYDERSTKGYSTSKNSQLSLFDISDRLSYKSAYQGLPEKLAKKYTYLSFENHCYLRIALDNTLHAKWDRILQKPAYKHLNATQLKHVVQLLKRYDADESLLKRHNTISLNYRKK
ncbi:MAG: hypothetical protein AAF611_15790 [Bacteroidota bacterium]